jgi:hypothetical protein
MAAVDLALNVAVKLREQQKTRRPGQRQEFRRHNGRDEAPDFFYVDRTCDGVKRWL